MLNQATLKPALSNPVEGSSLKKSRDGQTVNSKFGTLNEALYLALNSSFEVKF